MQTKQKVVLGCTLAITLAAPLAHGAVTVVELASPTITTVAGGAAGPLSGFNVSQFTFVASRNVALYADADAAGTTVAVSSANIKGRQTFGGSSNGGSVAACQTTSVSAPTPLGAVNTTNAGTGCN